MNVSFGAKLATKPEQFYLKSDTVADKKHIDTVLGKIDEFLQLPHVKEFTKDDVVELVRSKSKNKFGYNILYKTQNELGEAVEHTIRMNINGKPKDFKFFDFLLQFANVMYHKSGTQPPKFASIRHHISHILATIARLK